MHDVRPAGCRRSSSARSATTSLRAARSASASVERLADDVRDRVALRAEREGQRDRAALDTIRLPGAGSCASTMSFGTFSSYCAGRRTSTLKPSRARPAACASALVRLTSCGRLGVAADAEPPAADRGEQAQRTTSGRGEPEPAARVAVDAGGAAPASRAPAVRRLRRRPRRRPRPAAARAVGQPRPGRAVGRVDRGDHRGRPSTRRRAAPPPWAQPAVPAVGARGQTSSRAACTSASIAPASVGPAARVAPGGPGDQVVEHRRQARHELRRRRHVAVDVLPGDVDRPVAVVGHPAGEHLEQHDAGGVDVGARIGVAVGDQLRRHVRGGGHQLRCRASSALRLDRAGQAEVGDLDHAVDEVVGAAAGRLGDQHVLRLDVAVHQAGPVRGGDRGEHLLEDRPAPPAVAAGAARRAPRAACGRARTPSPGTAGRRGCPGRRRPPRSGGSAGRSSSPRR